MIGGLLLWVLTFGLSTLANFFLLSAVPFGVFFFMMYKGKRNRMFWTIESGLFTLGSVGFILGLLSSRQSSGSSVDETGLLFIGSYFAFLLLAIAAITLSSGLLRAQLVLHNLGRLAVSVATGWITDPQVISRRFERIMRSSWRNEMRQVAGSGRLLGFKRYRDFGNYRHEVIYQWVIETYGEVPFAEWLNTSRDRLRGLLGDRIGTREGSHTGSNVGDDSTNDDGK